MPIISVATRTRRVLEAVAFVAGWMTIGWVVRAGLARNAATKNLDFTVVYILMGVPLTLVFQRFVQREPIRALWLRAAPEFRLGRWGVALAAVLILIPAAGVFTSVYERDWPLALFGLLSSCGAIPAAYALRKFRRATLVQLALCLAVTSVLDVAASWVLHQFFKDLPAFLRLTPERAGITLLMTLYYIPVCFVFEEVTFRGALDAHIQRAGEANGWLSAVFISALWGLWHLPTAYPGGGSLPLLAAVFLVVHVAVGVPMSLYWRRSGNLVVPALAHGFIDALRDVLNVS